MDTSPESVHDLSPERRALLALLLERKGKRRETQTIPRLDRTGENLSFPLSFAQQRLWFVDQLDETHALYNQYVAMRLSGTLSLPSLEAALNGLVARHEVLRTVFVVEAGEPRQQILPAQPVALPLDALDELPADEREAEAMRRIRAEIAQPFDLARGPLLRARVLRLDSATHVLILSFHHIVADGWSCNVIVRELATLYTVGRQEAPTLPPLAVQYADYAAWQRSMLQGPTLQEQLDYWTRQLAGAPELLALPTDAPRPPVQRYEGAIHEQRLPATVYAGLSTLSQREGATLFMALLAGFHALLSRVSEQADVVVGTPIAGRARAELEGLVGCFVNMLPLRLQLGGNPTVRELLQRVRTVALEAYAHQELPFEHLVAALQPTRSLSHSPLFQVIFVLQNTGSPALQLEDVAAVTVELPSTSAMFDLTLVAIEEDQGLRLRIEYNTHLFMETTATRLLGQYIHLLATMVTQPDRRLNELDLLSDGERAAVLALSHGPARPYPAHTSLADLFFAQAARTPTAPALITADTTLTYHHLAAEVARLAHLLRAHGVGPEVRVGLALPRSPALVTAVLAVWAAGAAYVPLDPAYPPARRQFILADALVALVLTSQAHAAAGAADAAVPHLVLDDPAVRAQLAAAPTAPPPTAAHPDQLAYVIYTSGSTGTPKGVLGLQRGALNRCAWMWHTYPFAPADIACHKTALGFLDSLWEIAGPLLQGRPLLLVPEPVLTDPQALLALLAAHAVTHLVLVPALLHTLLDAAPDLAQRLPQLHTWVTSGEALPGALAQRFLAQLPGRRLLNLYGASEISADATAQALTPAVVTPSSASVPIGRPIANTAAYVLDAHGRLLPPGVPGELSIGGVAVARGYHARPDLTAERFVPDPFGGEAGARLYRTGDRACWRADGTLDYLGRQDGQLQVRGVRIEPGEVEAVLRQHQTVAEAVVVGQGAGAERRLVAYVVGRDGPATVDGRALRQWLRAQVPPALVPELILPLAVLPRTPSGKLDRLVLPIVHESYGLLDEPAMPPKTEMEQALAAIWADVLDLPAVGIQHNFFDLGGHSLLLVQIQVQLREKLKRDVPIVDLLTYPSIESLARYLSQEQADQQEFQQEYSRVKAGKEARQRRRSGAARPHRDEPESPPDSLDV